MRTISVVPVTFSSGRQDTGFSVYEGFGLLFDNGLDVSSHNKTKTLRDAFSVLIRGYLLGDLASTTNVVIRSCDIKTFISVSESLENVLGKETDFMSLTLV